MYSKWLVDQYTFLLYFFNFGKGRHTDQYLSLLKMAHSGSYAPMLFLPPSLCMDELSHGDDLAANLSVPSSRGLDPS
jgi:hypothetical protein